MFLRHPVKRSCVTRSSATASPGQVRFNAIGKKLERKKTARGVNVHRETTDALIARSSALSRQLRRRQVHLPPTAPVVLFYLAYNTVRAVRHRSCIADVTHSWRRDRDNRGIADERCLHCTLFISDGRAQPTRAPQLHHRGQRVASVDEATTPLLDQSTGCDDCRCYIRALRDCSQIHTRRRAVN